MKEDAFGGKTFKTKKTKKEGKKKRRRKKTKEEEEEEEKGRGKQEGMEIYIPK